MSKARKENKLAVTISRIQFILEIYVRGQK